MRQQIVYGWNFIFNAEVSPLRHISDVAVRHYVLQALALMWAVLPLQSEAIPYWQLVLLAMRP